MSTYSFVEPIGFHLVKVKGAVKTVGGFLSGCSVYGTGAGITF